MSNIKLPGSRTFYLQIIIHYITQNNDFIMDKELQKHMSKMDRKRVSCLRQ